MENSKRNKWTLAMKKTSLIVVSLLVFCACRTSLGVRNSEVKYFDKTFSATASNFAFKVNGKRYGSPTLLGLFEIRNDNAESVTLNFNDSGKLILTYKSADSIKTKAFNGRFTKEGFYEIYFRNESKEVPPHFPIFYSKHNINRIRIALTIENDLIIDNWWNEGGNIFILGVGDKGRRQQFFKQIN